MALDVAPVETVAVPSFSGALKEALMTSRRVIPPVVVFMVIGIFLLLVVFIGDKFFNLKPPAETGISRGSNVVNPSSEAGSNTTPVVGLPTQPPRDTAAEELAAAMSRAESALGKCDRCKTKLDKLTSLVTGWNNVTKEIETNDTGKRIAVSPVSVRTYLEVMKPTQAYADEGQIGRLRERLRLLQVIPNTAKEKQERGYSESKAWADGMAELDTDIRKETAILESGLGLINSLLDSVPKASVETPTLAAAIAAERKKRNDEKLALIQNKEAEAIKIGNEQVAEARKRAVETDKKLEAKKALDEAMAKEDKAKKEKLREKAKSDEVKKYLGHFFVESYYQPTSFDKIGSARYLWVERTDEKLPMSYRKLVGLGATADKIEGLNAINMISGAYGVYNSDKYDRPLIRGEIEPDRWTNDKHEFLRKARDLLKELGPILVEEGLLSP